MKNGEKNIQAATYNGACMVGSIVGAILPKKYTFLDLHSMFMVLRIFNFECRIAGDKAQSELTLLIE